MFNRLVNKLMIVTCTLCLVSCAVTQSSYIPEIKLDIRPKALNCVEYLSQKPRRASLRIGSINVSGNGFSKNEDLVEDAKKQAAKIGGDFILVENAGVESKTVYSPGYSSYESNANVFANNLYGQGSANASAFSIGPSIDTYYLPWGCFSVWVYVPSQTGIRFDDCLVVNGFHLNSDAVASGVKKGDKLLGMNGCDIMDEAFIHCLMNIYPGNKVTVNLERDGKRIDCQITAIEN